MFLARFPTALFSVTLCTCKIYHRLDLIFHEAAQLQKSREENDYKAVRMTRWEYECGQKFLFGKQIFHFFPLPILFFCQSIGSVVQQLNTVFWVWSVNQSKNGPCTKQDLWAVLFCIYFTETVWFLYNFLSSAVWLIELNIRQEANLICLCCLC